MLWSYVRSAIIINLSDFTYIFYKYVKLIIDSLNITLIYIYLLIIELFDGKNLLSYQIHLLNQI